MGEGRMIPRICECCGNHFETPERGLRRGRGTYCGRTCSVGAANTAKWEKYHSTVNEWFWDKMDRSAGEDACWPWTGWVMQNRGGYGRIRWRGRYIGTHRMALMLAKGWPPVDAMMACHTCDNPICCNPGHLWWGTAAENMQDASAKGRMSSRAIVDSDRALEMREAGLSLKEIAAEFCVHLSSAGKAIKRGAALRARAGKGA